MKDSVVKFSTLLAINPAHAENYAVADAAVMKVPPADLLKAADYSGRDDDVESYILQVQDNVGVISVNGLLTNQDRWYNRYYGMLAYQEIQRAIIEAVELGLKALLYSFSSPGGAVTGMEETAELISSSGLPSISHNSGGMMSAAYFLGIQADEVYTSVLAESGSVGVYAKVFDQSKMLEDWGIRVERFRSGSLKGTGDPNFKLSAEERKYIQKHVDDAAAVFYSVVADGRGLPLEYILNSEITTGASFMGEDALRLGLVDGILTFNESLAKVYDLARKTVDTGTTRGLF